MSLSAMQRKYIWMAGCHPDRIIEQGRGKRTRKLLYALDGSDTLVLFGYSNPMEWLVHRDLFRPLQARNTYTLTGAGEMIFEQIKARGGMMNDLFEEVRIKQQE